MNSIVFHNRFNNKRNKLMIILAVVLLSNFVPNAVFTQESDNNNVIVTLTTNWFKYMAEREETKSLTEIKYFIEAMKSEFGSEF